MLPKPDDQIDADDATEQRPKTVSKAAFACMSWTLFILIVITESACTMFLTRRLGVRLDSSWLGGLGMLNLILAKVATDGILKLMGLSRSGKTFEARGRTVAFSEGEVADDEVVELRYPSSFITGLGVACLAFCLVMAVLLITVPHDKMKGVGWAYFIIGFFGLGAGYCFYARLWGKPHARADSTGITGIPVGFHLSLRFVSWSDVATCEIETYYDTFGKPVIIKPTLKGYNDENLMALNLMYTKMDDQERLVKYIKAKLPKPKPKDDLWE
jgi:hypothetical protein